VRQGVVVGLERLQSGSELLFVERGLPTNLVPNRDVGAQLFGDLFDGTISYALGAFNGVPDLGNGDLDNNGSWEVIEAYVDRELMKEVPWRDYKIMGHAVPGILERFTTYAAYGTASLEELFGDALKRTQLLKANTLESVVLLNRGDHFEVRALPLLAQLTPAFATVVADFDGDGNEDIFLSQNFFNVEVETSRYDSGLGLWLRGEGTGNFKTLSAVESGVSVFGEQRGCALADYDADGRIDLAVAQNRAATRLYHNVLGRPGLRVRLIGPLNNPSAVGACIRVESAGKWGANHEVHMGSGYWSQDGAVLVLGTPATPDRIQVRWRGAAPVVASLPPGAGEISVDMQGQIQAVKQ
jgi:hypothetical protein